MRYRLLYTKRAAKDIRKLDPEVRQRVGKALLRYAKDPLKFAERLTDPKLGTTIDDLAVFFFSRSRANLPRSTPSA